MGKTSFKTKRVMVIGEAVSVCTRVVYGRVASLSPQTNVFGSLRSSRDYVALLHRNLLKTLLKTKAAQRTVYADRLRVAGHFCPPVCDLLKRLVSHSFTLTAKCSEGHISLAGPVMVDAVSQRRITAVFAGRMKSTADSCLSASFIWLLRSVQSMSVESVWLRSAKFLREAQKFMKCWPASME